MEPVKIQANFIPKTGMFLFQVVSEEGKSVKVQLPCDQFLAMVQYLGKVALSYQEWLKAGAPPVEGIEEDGN
jgi:hypothetical protein